jgi:phosphatidylglycerophosphate synthase
MENTTQSNRIQTSILNGVERKALIWLAKRQPSWVTSDMLTSVGSIGAVIIAVGYMLSGININFLWLATFGFLVNWYGDSLDGTLARVRNAQRPLYGFFVDHMIDCFNEVAMFIGVGLSPLMHLNLALLVLVFYLLLSVYVYISAHLKGEFKLTYAKMGPTELRLLIMIVNTIFIYVAPIRDYVREITLFGRHLSMTVFDFVAVFLVIVLAIMLIVSFFHDAKAYAKIDPRIRNVKDSDK